MSVAWRASRVVSWSRSRRHSGRGVGQRGVIVASSSSLSVASCRWLVW
ncbi:hypothetical protein ACXZ9C_11735 [Streptococcus agalactiae]